MNTVLNGDNSLCMLICICSDFDMQCLRWIHIYQVLERNKIIIFCIKANISLGESSVLMKIFIFFSFLATLQHIQFPSGRSDRSCSWSSTGSLTHCVWLGIKLRFVPVLPRLCCSHWARRELQKYSFLQWVLDSFYNFRGK